MLGAALLSLDKESPATSFSSTMFERMKQPQIVAIALIIGTS